MADLQWGRLNRWRVPRFLCVGLVLSLLGVAGRGQRGQAQADPRTPPKETLSQLFEALGIEDDGPENDAVDQKKLKSAHRAASLKYHPDKNPDAKDAKARFNAVRDAYEVLSDPVKTLLYDTGGRDLVQKYETNSQEVKSTPDKDIKVSLKLEEVYSGSKRIFRLSKRVVCRSCRTMPQLARCQKCFPCPATRQVKTFIQNGRLHRSSEDIPSLEKCLTTTESLDIVVEKGMMTGDTVLFQNAGTQMPNQVPGDVTVKITVEPHRLFRRVGNDLELTVEVSLFDALLGFEREVVHLNGHIVKFGVERGQVLRPEGSIVIEGEGMPLRDDPTTFGRLIVRFEVQFPDEIPSYLQEKLEEVLLGSNQRPLPRRIDYRGPVVNQLTGNKRTEL